jgi:hypothetical protein
VPASDGEDEPAMEPLEVLMVTPVGAVTFVFVASGMLLLLYFLLNHVFALVLVSPPGVLV